MLRLALSHLALALALLAGACSGGGGGGSSSPPAGGAQATAAPPTTTAPVRGVRVLAVHPHDPDAFTQGLDWDDGNLYEGTGLEGRSTLRLVDLESGQVLRVHNLAADLFGEGIAVVGNRIVQLTWQDQRGFVYDRDTFTPQSEFAYPGEGWGLTFDGGRLIMSDGTAELRFLDEDTFAELGRVRVKDGPADVRLLNELEFIEGEVWANVWMTTRIARINPATGRVSSWVDLAGIFQEAGVDPGGAGVANGVAWDETGRRLFVTGKNWPALFQVEVE